MTTPVPDRQTDEKKEGIIAKRKVEQLACEPMVDLRMIPQIAAGQEASSADNESSDNASNFTTGRAAASFTSTTLIPETKSERAMFDEEECMTASDSFVLLLI